MLRFNNKKLYFNAPKDMTIGDLSRIIDGDLYMSAYSHNKNKIEICNDSCIAKLNIA